MYGNIIIIIIVNPLNSSQHYEPLHKFTKLLHIFKQTIGIKNGRNKGKSFRVKSAYFCRFVVKARNLPAVVRTSITNAVTTWALVKTTKRMQRK